MQACVMCVCTDVCMHVCAPRVRGCERARTHTHSRHKPVRAQLPVSEPRGETGSPECGGGGGRYQRGQAWLGPSQSGTLGAPEHGKDSSAHEPRALAGRSVRFRAGPPGGPFPQGLPSSRRLNKG